MRRVGGREQLEHRKRHAAGVDLFEDLADGFARGLLAELDHRELVLLETLDEGPAEGMPELDLVPVEVPVLLQPHRPVVRIEDEFQREQQLLVLPVPGGHIQGRFAPEVADDPVVRHELDGVLPGDAVVERGADVDVEPARHRLVPDVLGLHRLVQAQRLEQGREPLLAVQDEPVGTSSGRRCGSLDRALLELDVTPGTQQHDRPDRVTQRDRGEQARDARLRPHPASLELG